MTECFEKKRKKKRVVGICEWLTVESETKAVVCWRHSSGRASGLRMWWQGNCGRWEEIEGATNAACDPHRTFRLQGLTSTSTGYISAVVVFFLPVKSFSTSSLV